MSFLLRKKTSKKQNILKHWTRPIFIIFASYSVLAEYFLVYCCSPCTPQGAPRDWAPERFPPFGRPWPGYHYQDAVKILDEAGILKNEQQLHFPHAKIVTEESIQNVANQR